MCFVLTGLSSRTCFSMLAQRCARMSCACLHATLHIANLPFLSARSQRNFSTTSRSVDMSAPTANSYVSQIAPAHMHPFGVICIGAAVQSKRPLSPNFCTLLARAELYQTRFVLEDMMMSTLVITQQCRAYTVGSHSKKQWNAGQPASIA